MHRLDPHHGTPAYHQAVSRIHGACSKVFRRQKDRALAKAKELTKSKRSRMFKDDPDDASDFDPGTIADGISEDVFEEYRNLPSEVRPALEQAMLSGMNTGFLQLQLHDTDLISKINRIAEEYAIERAAELVGMKYDVEGNLVDNPNAEWDISDTTRDKIKAIVAEAFEGETKMADVAAKIQAALEADDAGIFSDARAKMIANTEVAHAQAGGNFEVWKKSGMVETVKWTVSADEPCDICAENEDEVVDFGEEFDSGDIMPPAHPNCLVAGVVVSACDGITKFFKRRFHGEIITLRIAAGKELTITPNHQILTDRGWIAAHAIEKSDKIAYCRAEVVSAAAVHPHDHLMPTVIENVASTLLESGKMSSSSMPTSPEDFHGDVTFDSKVEIVGPESFLKFEIELRGGEQVGELTLCRIHARRMGFSAESSIVELGRSVLHATDGAVRCFDEVSPILEASATHAKQHRGAAIADRKSELLEPVANHGTVNADAPGEIDARFAGAIEFVQVTDTRVTEFEGHVYNLETESGYYFAEGIIVHNCRCVLVAVKIADDQE